MQMLKGDPCGICEAARCCDEKGDRYAFALMGWELLDLGDRLCRLAENRLLKQFSHCSSAVNTAMLVS
jgi:hypothetical protein